ncbi:MAG: helix-turn-helix domain-containing protein [Anaerolineae bacterium]
MDEIALRKEAVRLGLLGTPKSEIARRLGRSRLWVYRWLGRYHPDDPEGPLSNRSSAPKRPHRQYPEDVRQLALNSRRARQAGHSPGYKYALVGADAIHYELREMGVSPLPPPRTIHAWLKQAGLIQSKAPRAEEARPLKPYPNPPQETTNDLHQLDLKGPFYLSGGPQKHYLVALRDVCSKVVALDALCNRRMETMIDFLIMAWNKMGCPKRLQMDNGLEFRGSNRYPRSLGQLVRVCLDLGVEPVFIPPHEPWRNGVIENLNGLLEHLWLKREYFADYTHLRGCVQEVEAAINTTHRLPALNGQTPAEFAAGASLRFPPPGYDWRKRDLQLVKGKVSFIRLVRKSGRITLCANDKFEIGQEYQWHYVLATVDLSSSRLDIYHQGELIKSFDYP